MIEKGIWKQLKRLVAGRGHFERIENSVSAGRPDVNYCIDVGTAAGFEGNIELKYRGKAPVRPETPVFPKGKGLRPQQVAWMIMRCRARGVVFIYAGVGKKAYLIPADESVAMQFNSFTMLDLETLNLLRPGLGVAHAIIQRHRFLQVTRVESRTQASPEESAGMLRLMRRRRKGKASSEGRSHCAPATEA